MIEKCEKDDRQIEGNELVLGEGDAPYIPFYEVLG